MKSIQRHLTFTLLAVVLALAAAAGALLYLLARSRLIAEFDRGLAAEAQALSAMVTRDSSGKLEFDFVPAAQPEFQDAGLSAYFEIWQPDGSVISRSPSLGVGNLPRLQAAGANVSGRPILLPGGNAGRAIVLRFTPHQDEDDQRPARAHAAAAPPAPLLTLVLAREPHELNRTLWVLGSSLLVAGLALAVGTVVLVTFAVRRGLSPLHRLAAEADAIDAASLQNRFSQESLPGELRPISARLNNLLARLADAFARERRFTSDAAHELRTPIAELRAMAEVAIRWPQDARPDGYYRDTLAIARQMEAMVTALLSIARCQAGVEQARMESVDLAEAVREAWASHAAGVNRGLSVRQELPDHVVIRSDRAILLALIGNLMSNAFAHTPDGGEIVCRLACIDSSADLVISNTCHTLGPDDLPHLFEPFWRKDKSRTGGTHCGLGLSLVAAYAQALGTEPRARLTSDGTFHISISFPAAHPVQKYPQFCADRGLR